MEKEKVVKVDRLSCLVLNAGGTYHPSKDRAEAWATAAVGGPQSPDIAFIQEVPSEDWLDVWRRHGYAVALGHVRGWRVRSAILVRLQPSEWTSLTTQEVPELAYHGEYVVAVRLFGWGPGGADLALLSVHAQPSPTTKEYLDSYPRAESVTRRDGGADARYKKQLFDADVVLETIARQAPNVLACGDLNEARGWDDVHSGHTWGEEFFGRMEEGVLVSGVVQAKQLVEVPLSDSGEEVVTRRAPGHPPLQLDHILTSGSVAPRISDVRVDHAWTQKRNAADGLADHAPIWFRIDRD
jgi:hypothetical protein